MGVNMFGRNYTERDWNLVREDRFVPHWPNRHKLAIVSPGPRIFNEVGLAMALHRANQKCEICQSDKSLERHHCHYRTPGTECMWDIMILCRSCHEARHRVKMPSGIIKWFYDPEQLCAIKWNNQFPNMFPTII